MRSVDRLSNLPSCIIETILCLLPIQEAGRTSILSREWRYRWTKIPKLAFEEDDFQVSTIDGAESSIWEQNMDRNNKLIYGVGQVLLMHDGSIHEFTLSLLPCGECFKIDPILTHLSRKTSIKKLKLDFGYVEYMLPSSIFSFHKLRDLSLDGCRFNEKQTFNRLGCLTNLYLHDVFISTRTLLRFLSSCPLLKTVILNIDWIDISICRNNDGRTFKELLECLPLIETLFLLLDIIKTFDDCVDGRVPRELQTPLFHLKYLDIDHVSFTHKEELILAFLIKSSPNLEKLKISDGATAQTSTESSSRVKCYQGIMLEHLNELEIKEFVDHKARFDFVKFILARSPVLKKVRIFPLYLYRDKKLHISEILLGYSRASPEVQIIVEDPCYD